MSIAMRAPVLVLLGLLVMAGCGSRQTPIVDVLEASDGGNCGAPRGNVTHALAAVCTGRAECGYEVPAPGPDEPVGSCAKEYVAVWRCGDEVTLRRAAVTRQPAARVTVSLTCH